MKNRFASYMLPGSTKADREIRLQGLFKEYCSLTLDASQAKREAADKFSQLKNELDLYHEYCKESEEKPKEFIVDI